MQSVRRATVLIFLACSGTISAEIASAARKTLKPAGEAKVVAVLNGNTVRLSSGDTARLVGTEAPLLDRRADIPWPHAEAAKKALERLVFAKRIRLFYAGRRVDRYGRRLIHAFVGDIWVQRALIAHGHVRVRSYKDNRLRVGELLAAEAKARQEKRGLWSHSRYAVRTPVTVIRDLESWQIVRGVVKDVAALRRATYLNFGDNWRKDFTIQIKARTRTTFRKAGIDLKALKGQPVRVRGWVRNRNGPLIVVTHPEQLEVSAERIPKP